MKKESEIRKEIRKIKEQIKGIKDMEFKNYVQHHYGVYLGALEWVLKD